MDGGKADEGAGSRDISSRSVRLEERTYSSNGSSIKLDRARIDRGKQLTAGALLTLSAFSLRRKLPLDRAGGETLNELALHEDIEQDHGQ